MTIQGFYTPKIWRVPEKIAKYTKNIPIDSFLLAIFDSTKIFSKILMINLSSTAGILLKLSCGHTLSRSRYPGKRYNWTLIHFVTHLLHQGRLLGPLKMPKILARPKKHGKFKATPFLEVFEVSGSESDVRISIKILVLKLSNLMTLIVHNCRVRLIP